MPHIPGKTAAWLSLAVLYKVIALYLLIHHRRELNAMRKILARAGRPMAKILVRPLWPADFGAHVLRGFLLIALLILLFGQLAEDVVSREIGHFDQVITGQIRCYTGPPLTAVMKVITGLDSPGMLTALLIPTAGLLFLRRRPASEPVLLAAATVGSWLLNELLKWSFHRPRPDGNWLVRAAGYSFPSGHSMVAVAFYGTLGYLLWTWLPKPVLRWSMAGICTLLVLSIGISRIYLGVHYPSDVLAGFIAGACWLTVCILAYETARHRTTTRSANGETG